MADPQTEERAALTEATRSQTSSHLTASPASIIPQAEAEAHPTCAECGALLTAKASVRRLLGPVCASRVEGVRHALVD